MHAFLIVYLHDPFVLSMETGYFEDRRPASNMDPYVVTGMIAETTLLM